MLSSGVDSVLHKLNSLSEKKRERRREKKKGAWIVWVSLCMFLLNSYAWYLMNCLIWNDIVSSFSSFLPSFFFCAWWVFQISSSFFFFIFSSLSLRISTLLLNSCLPTSIVHRTSSRCVCVCVCVCLSFFLRAFCTHYLYFINLSLFCSCCDDIDNNKRREKRPTRAATASVLSFFFFLLIIFAYGHAFPLRVPPH